jgi:molecular chaperone DnaK
MTAIYGIDLGTTFTKCALADADGHVRIIELDVDPTAPGKRIQPLRSAVTLGNDGRGRKVAWVGTKSAEVRAKWTEGELPIRTFEETKLYIGGDNVVVSGAEPPWPFEPHDWEYMPHDIAALILRKAKAEVEAAGGPPLVEAVITHPQCFGTLQREATRRAGAIAGIKVRDLLTEPDAAAIAYSQALEREGRYLLFDLGGGTLDIVVLDIKGRVAKAITSEGPKFGGKDWDAQIFAALCNRYAQITDQEFRSDMLTELGRAEWLAHAERIKRILNEPGRDRDALLRYRIPVEPGVTLYEGSLDDNPPPFTYECSLADFGDLTAGLVSDCRRAVEDVLSNIGFKPRELQGILLVGGSTNLVHVAESLREFDVPLHADLDPHTVVARGAAMHARSLASGRAGDTVRVVTEYKGALARGVGLLATNRNRRDEQVIVPLVRKDTPLPLDHPEERTFLTDRADERDSRIQLFEGESEDPKECERIGDCVLSGFPPGPAETPVKMRLHVEANGTLQVTAIVGGVERSAKIEFPSDRVPGEREITRRRTFLDSIALVIEARR